jgi:hypothetical protein
MMIGICGSDFISIININIRYYRNASNLLLSDYKIKVYFLHAYASNNIVFTIWTDCQPVVAITTMAGFRGKQYVHITVTMNIGLDRTDQYIDCRINEPPSR